MTKNFKIFLIVLILAFPVYWGINILEKNLEDFFYWHEMSQNPKILAAQTNQQMLEQRLREMKPIKDPRGACLEPKARSAISIFLDNQGNEKILFEKNAYQKLPIASLTKLMTARVVLEHYDLSKEIKISKEAVEQEEDFGKLEVGGIFPAEYFLYPLLMESSNDAAFALANDYAGMTGEQFVYLMNLEAQKLSLKNTHFVNSTGLDPEEQPAINYSTADDLAKLAKALLKDNPLIWEILSIPELDSYGPRLVNTNELLGEISGIIGGKTGYTEKASGCFLLVLAAPKSKGYLINVILGSGDRFGEMEELADWLCQAYKW